MTYSFYLDNDVDADCVRVLRAAGHRCWTAGQAARQDALDDDQTVYAIQNHAVLVTHDREFTERRKRMPIGQHVRLVCRQLDGPTLLEQSMDVLINALASSPDVTIEISPGRHGVSKVKLWFGSGENRPSRAP